MGKRYVGERILQNCGEYAEIIKLLPKGRCKVRFDSGMEKVCLRSSFSKGTIRTVFRYVGERILQSCGEYAEIIELLSDNRCKIKFESEVVKECDRTEFFRGKVSNIIRDKYCIGDMVKQDCGEYAKIIELLSDGRCIIEFEDGTRRKVRKHIFRRGEAQKPRKVYDNRSRKQNCGAIAFLVKRISYEKCIVRFEDGLEIECNAQLYLGGNISPPFLVLINRHKYYKKSNELLLSMYFDRILGHYVGVLRRSDGTRYVRVLD